MKPQLATPKAEVVAPHEAYFTFSPRPDQPSRFDEQTAFIRSTTPGVAFMLGGNGAGTTECALHKVARFVLEQQTPPRADTPFWIISNSYEVCCETAWKEKLLGHGHIPTAEIDWERIQWYKRIRGWPLAVPLKPWPDAPGRNWVLEFKSYEQGRRLMQARAIGGFCFIEQFPWILLTEVLRGCREYDFRGNKIAEFTPIEPGLAEQLEEMLETDTLPDGWRVYRANTTCALEAGHVNQEWYDQFFAMVPESMRATREIGAMPTYEGAIYSTFNPRLHVHDISDRAFPRGVVYRRMIDWGSGPDNAFCCLWGYKNHAGQWFIFDEYYSNDLTRTVIDHLCEVADRWPWPFGNPHYGTTWADPSGSAYFRIAGQLGKYGPKDEQSGEPQYQNLPISAANNRVFEGIEHVQYMLKSQRGNPPPFPGMKPLGSDGWPLLFIDRNCRNLRRELRTYRWEQRDKGSKTANPKDAKPQPLKKDDHAVDALRYGLYSEAGLTIGKASAMHREDRAEAHGVHITRAPKRGVRLNREGRKGR